jgi:hypothetical protein
LTAFTLALVAITPAAAKPVTICGITASSVAALEKQIRADRTLVIVSAGPTYTSWRRGQMIWNVSKPGHLAHPIAVCLNPGNGKSSKPGDAGGALCEASAYACAQATKGGLP